MKYKKQVRLYDRNPTTGIEELALIESAARITGSSLEDFIAGAALQTAARTVVEFQEQKTRDLKAKMDAAVSADTKGDTNGSQDTSTASSEREGSIQAQGEVVRPAEGAAVPG